MQDFSHRLDAVARDACFTTADLALWFDSHYATVRAWRDGINVPNAARLPQLEERLKWLKEACRVDAGLPVPLTVRAGDRKEYILGVRQRFSKK